MHLSELVANIAIRQIQNLTAGTKFRVRDLYQNAGWELVPLSDRQQIGRHFYRIADETGLFGTVINVVEYDDSGDATLYEKL